MEFDIGYTRQDELKVRCGDADLDFYVIDGESPYDIVKQFRKIIGVAISRRNSLSVSDRAAGVTKLRMISGMW